MAAVMPILLAPAVAVAVRVFVTLLAVSVVAIRTGTMGVLLMPVVAALLAGLVAVFLTAVLSVIRTPALGLLMAVPIVVAILMRTLLTVGLSIAMAV